MQWDMPVLAVVAIRYSKIKQPGYKTYCAFCHVRLNKT